ncbi:MAG: hypothetical protein ACI9U2_001642 [Bradymonadia bacterium]
MRAHHRGVQPDRRQETAYCTLTIFKSVTNCRNRCDSRIARRRHIGAETCTRWRAAFESRKLSAPRRRR